MAMEIGRGGAENREMNKNNDLKAFFPLVLCFPFCRCSAELVQLAPWQMWENQLIWAGSLQSGRWDQEKLGAVSGVAVDHPMCSWEVFSLPVASWPSASHLPSTSWHYDLIEVILKEGPSSMVASVFPSSHYRQSSSSFNSQGFSGSLPEKPVRQQEREGWSD